MDRDALTGAMIEGRYVFGAILHEGELTNLYAAEDVRIGAEVSIEVLRDGLGNGSLAARAFKRRATTACRVHHPSILSPHDLGTLDDDSPFVVTKRIAGELLEERIVLGGALPWQDVVRLGVQILAGIGAAHASGVIHGAVGPDTIAVGIHDDELVTAHVAGFGGIARRIDEETPLGYQMLAFSAPEVSARRAPTVRSDLHSVGAVLYLAATGYAPYSAGSVEELAEAIAYGALREPSRLRPELPVALERVLLRALAIDPRDRYRSAIEMLRELASVQAKPRVEAATYVAYESSVVPRSARTLTELPPATERGGAPSTRRGVGPLPMLGVTGSGIVLRAGVGEEDATAYDRRTA